VKEREGPDVLPEEIWPEAGDRACALPDKPHRGPKVQVRGGDTDIRKTI
jgi:hypothetical protein